MALIYRTAFATTKDVYANSGYWSDIQNAVDQAASGDNVYIPEGTFNFVNVGEWGGGSYGVVTVPAGINIFGAPCLTDEKGFNTEWKTVLKLPWNAPGGKTWFFFDGGQHGDVTNKSSRFSDIKMIGYAYYAPGTVYNGPGGLVMNEIMNYRVDHCHFQDITGMGIWAGWMGYPYGIPMTMHCCGLIDHNNLINTWTPNANPGQPFGDNSLATQGYGVMLGRIHNSFWESDVSKVFGHYTNYTTVIEDNHFSLWRHDICVEWGAHAIVRHNTFDNDFGFRCVDLHGIYNVVPARAVEFYDNTCSTCKGFSRTVTFFRGGSALVYNNIVDSTYTVLCELSADSLTWEPSDYQHPTDTNGVELDPGYIGYPHDVYVWNNTVVPGTTILANSNGSHDIVDVDYFLHEPTGYTPLPYPFLSSPIKLSVDSTPIKTGFSLERV